jgi:hypothetical protein
MADLQRDTTQLQGMATSLTELKVGFTSLKDNLGDPQQLFGSDEVRKAFKGFTDNWSDARKDLEKQIDAAVEALGAIVALYDGLETQIAASASPGPAAPGPAPA